MDEIRYARLKITYTPLEQLSAEEKERAETALQAKLEEKLKATPSMQFHTRLIYLLSSYGLVIENELTKPLPTIYLHCAEGLMQNELLQNLEGLVQNLPGAKLERQNESRIPEQPEIL